MSRKFRRGIPRAIAALAVFLAFFVLTAVLLGAEEESPAQGALLEDLPLSASLTLLAQEEDRAWLVFNGPLESRVLLADAATGKVLASREGGPVAAAFLRGGSLILCETAQTSVAFTRLSPTLEEEQWEFFRLSSLLRRFDLSPEGGLYAVDSTTPAVLTYTSRTGSEEKVTFSQEVQFLQATPQGRLYVCAGDILYLSEDGSLAGLTELPGGSLPVCLLGEEGYLDSNGTVCRVEDGAVEKALQLPLPLLTRAALYSGSPEGLALGESSTRLLWYSWDGEALDSCLVAGELQAVSPGLVVYQQDGAFYRAPTGFGQPEDAPTPTVSPAPTETPAPEETPMPEETPEPSDSPEPGETPKPGETPSPSPTAQPIPTPEAGWYPTTEGEYLLAPLGATVGELRQFFWPQAVQVEKPDGTTARDTEKLATGMTVPYSEKEGFPSAYTLVVPGDCTGLGLGSDRDVQAVQSHLLGEEPLTGPYLRAADLDNDGQVTVEDLVLFDTPAPTPTPVPTTPQPSQTE